jgi:release factor glutamine methyltransferase
MTMQQQEIYAELLSLIQGQWTGLPDKPDETPEGTLRALWFFAFGRDPYQAASGLALPELDEPSRKKLRALVDERLKKVPLAYLVGKAKFLDIELLSSPEAMIPRKETEIVGRVAVETVRQIVREHGGARVIDLCTGSGTLALAMAHAEPRCEVLGADLSSDAVSLAARNAEYLGLTSRAKFFQGDLFAPFESEDYYGKIDLITCNPPYIASAHVEKMAIEIQGFEPRLAFDGGPFGIQILTRLVREAWRYGKPGSWLCFEVGLGQGKAIANLIAKSGRYSAPEVFHDEAGEIRAIRTGLLS